MRKKITLITFSHNDDTDSNVGPNYYLPLSLDKLSIAVGRVIEKRQTSNIEKLS